MIDRDSPVTEHELHAYVDGELDPAHALEMERQFASDPALAAERDRVEACGFDRWLGGVHLHGHAGIWRWDGQQITRR